MDTNVEFMQHATATLLRVEKLLETIKPTSPILLRADAKQLAGCRSDADFSRWCKKWGVCAIGYGRYSRADIDLAVMRETGRAHVPATLRKKQAEAAS